MTTSVNNRESIDEEYAARRIRLQSELEQSRGEAVKLDGLRLSLESLSIDQPSDQDIRTVQKIEAELCLFKPAPLLYPTYLRLRSKFYRFHQDRGQAWERDLKRLMPDEHTITDEDVLRLRLRQLSLELYEEAKSFTRKANERSEVFRDLTITGIGMIVLLLIALAMAIIWPVESSSLFPQWIFAAAVAGGIGAITSTVGSVGKERARKGYKRTLQWQMGMRSLLGVVYALVVYAAVWGEILPLSVPDSAAKQLPFFLVLGFAAGFSDKLFGQTISQFITKGTSAGSSKEAG